MDEAVAGGRGARRARRRRAAVARLRLLRLVQLLRRAWRRLPRVPSVDVSTRPRRSPDDHHRSSPSQSSPRSRARRTATAGRVAPSKTRGPQPGARDARPPGVLDEARGSPVEPVRRALRVGRHPQPRRPADGPVGVVGRSRTRSTARPGTSSSASCLWLVLGSIALIVRDAHRLPHVAPARAAAPGRRHRPARCWCSCPASGLEVNGAHALARLRRASASSPPRSPSSPSLIFVADLLARRADRIDDTRLTLRPVLVGASCVVAGPDHAAAQPGHARSSSASSCSSMLFVAGTPLKPLVVAAGVGAALARLFAVVEPYRYAAAHGASSIRGPTR